MSEETVYWVVEGEEALKAYHAIYAEDKKARKGAKAFALKHGGNGTVYGRDSLDGIGFSPKEKPAGWVLFDRRVSDCYRPKMSGKTKNEGAALWEEMKGFKFATSKRVGTALLGRAVVFLKHAVSTCGTDLIGDTVIVMAPESEDWKPIEGLRRIKASEYWAARAAEKRLADILEAMKECGMADGRDPCCFVYEQSTNLKRAIKAGDTTATLNPYSHLPHGKEGWWGIRHNRLYYYPNNTDRGQRFTMTGEPHCPENDGDNSCTGWDELPPQQEKLTREQIIAIVEAKRAKKETKFVDDGGPVYPHLHNTTQVKGESEMFPGISLRQHYAGQFAAAWVVALAGKAGDFHTSIADEANRIGLLQADALIARSVIG